MGNRRSGIVFCKGFEHLRAYGFFAGQFFARINSAVLSVKTFVSAIELVLVTLPCQALCQVPHRHCLRVLARSIPGNRRSNKNLASRVSRAYPWSPKVCRGALDGLGNCFLRVLGALSPGLARPIPGNRWPTKNLASRVSRAYPWSPKVGRGALGWPGEWFF